MSKRNAEQNRFRIAIILSADEGRFVGGRHAKTLSHDQLQRAGVHLVMVSGFSAQHCVLATYLGAVERGYKAAILQQGVTSANPAAILEVYRDRHMVSYPVLEAFLAKS
ncbi:MAG: isochorismatase family protein [Bacteroidetes bacterium]|nr:isochorismatase family protein [Bacteroidota bacterium]